MTDSVHSLSGRSIITGLKSAGVRFVLSVPDITTSEGLLRPISEDGDLRLVRVCKEDEGVSVCAALSFCDQRAVLLMQQTGLMDSLNALRAIALDYCNPVCMLIGLLGKDPAVPPARSEKLGVRVIQPILDAMGIRHLMLDTDDDLPDCLSAIDEAYQSSRPVAILLGRSPT
ncbi:MAG: decarboxylase [Rhodoferax sp.]|nr:decarboxylase [Rhodoferax sp.]